jgi:glycosyltransferase involved in cell wall biosynthesis
MKNNTSSNTNSHKVLVVSSGIEDNGMRGLGVVTISLLDGLALAGYEPYLLTGAPIKSVSTANKSVKDTAVKRFLDHYLIDGYKSSAFKLTKGSIFKQITKDLIRLITGGITIIPQHPNIEATHRQTALRRFSNTHGYINFAFIYRLSRILPTKMSSLIIARLAKKSGAKIIMTASPFPIINSYILKSNNIKVIQYVHDVMPLNILETPPDLINTFSIQLEKSLLNADYVMTSSRNAKDKLGTLYPHIKFNVTYLPCVNRNEISNSQDSYLLGKLNLKENRYFLFMSSIEDRKNVSRLVEAFSILDKKSNVKLVLVGSKGYGWDNFETVMNSLPKEIRKNIILTGYISEEEKWSLINKCLAVVHPAIDEGLGLPAIEGIIARKPVVATRLPSIEEIAPPGCVKYIEDPYSIYDIAEKLKFILKKGNIDKKSLELGSGVLKERFSELAFSKRLRNILTKI